QHESVIATTADGVRLHLTRVIASELESQAAAGKRTRGAVVLQHGLGSNGGVFLVPQLSLAERLAELGYDCFVSELRGAGRSERPAKAWCLGDYLALDLPAVIATVCEVSAHPRVSWIGHSLGGVMMMLYGIDHPDAPIERLITVGSALDYKPGRNIYRSLRALRPAASLLPSIPFGALSWLNGLVAGVGPSFLAEGMNFQRSNIDRAVTRRLLASGFTSIPLALLDELNTTFDELGFQLSGRDAYLPRASALRIPTLMIGGSADPQCPSEATEASFTLLAGVQDKRRVTFGKAFGQADDYGHFDLLVGKRAASEVWPHIEAFLAGEPGLQQRSGEDPAPAPGLAVELEHGGAG
ncbi:MAG TPA: alpha/beta fold hydrolase, partial [Polyangiales bacterium]|nr:alpha/beta fold hydrolase [Polyangiales bacterium]